MSILIFALVALTGLLLTSFSFVYLAKRKNLNTNQQALIISIGLFLTWLGSFFFPFLAPNSQLPSKTIMIFGISFSVLFGLTVYVVARFYIALKQRDK
jgi:hypothetical protein